MSHAPAGEDKERITEVVLRVEEARNRDARKKRVRIDLPTMKKLGVRPGDVVEIEGKKKTVAIVWPLLPEDMNKNIIRMDGILRKSAGVNVGDKVIVRKAKVQPAIKVKLAPMNPSSPYDENFKNYMKKKLIGIPVVERDIVQVARNNNEEDDGGGPQQAPKRHRRAQGLLRGHRRPQPRHSQGERADRTAAPPPRAVRQARHRAAEGRAPVRPARYW